MDTLSSEVARLKRELEEAKKPKVKLEPIKEEKIKPDSKVVEKEPSAGVSQEKAAEITIPKKTEPSMKDIYKMMKKF